MKTNQLSQYLKWESCDRGSCEESWLVGRVVTNERFNSKAFKTMMVQTWKAKKGVNIHDVGNNLFSFRFFKVRDKDLEKDVPRILISGFRTKAIARRIGGASGNYLTWDSNEVNRLWALMARQNMVVGNHQQVSYRRVWERTRQEKKNTTEVESRAIDLDVGDCGVPAQKTREDEVLESNVPLSLEHIRLLSSNIQGTISQTDSLKLKANDIGANIFEQKANKCKKNGETTETKNGNGGISKEYELDR
ncbi:hypothetical protein JHK85_009538 [Glycine max]|nr:hypothetical protein JHK85_009538 [Glycine max]